MRAAKVPALALLILRDGGEVLIVQGVRNAETRAPVTPQTVFQTASLSKPVVARREALVPFANGERGLEIVPEIVNTVLTGDHPSLAWLGLSR
jgi:hypothetical protein